jgi:hypothetical protein
MGTLPRILITTIAATVAFFAAWTLVDEAEAAWTPCGNPNPPCNYYTTEERHYARYFASQSASPNPQQYSNGIRAYLSIADVALHDIECENYDPDPLSNGYNDPKCDFLANGLLMVPSDEFAQVGFVEGAVPWHSFDSTTPVVFQEAISTCPYDSVFLTRSTPTLIPGTTSSWA